MPTTNTPKRFIARVGRDALVAREAATLGTRGIGAVELQPAQTTAVFDKLASLPADFMADGRDDTPPQDREAL